MKLAPEIQTLFPELSVRENTPLASYTTFQLGGLCPLFIDNPTAEQLPALIQMFNEKEMPFLVIGQGSNLVISDQGLDYTVIRFCSEKPNIQADGTRVTVSGDTLLDDLVLFTIERNHGDLTYCTGIPGTVGGGLAGNAGAFGRQIGDGLISAKLLGLDGIVRTVTPNELGLSYRHSDLKKSGEIILSATFDLSFENNKIMRCERERIMTFRKEHHPEWHESPCAGSVFRNIEPTSAVERRKSAGYFLEEAGAKTLHVGGAHIFEKHANMIIGGDGCTAQNVWDLSEQMKQAVQKKFGLELIREIRFVGDFQGEV